MKEIQSEFIDSDQLRIGMFIELDAGWLMHSFPQGGFKVSSGRQIRSTGGLGLKRIRHVPGLSDPVQDSATVAEMDSVPCDQAAAEEPQPAELRDERIDGSGFPARVKGDKLSMLGRILALVNHHGNPCNPVRPAAAMTPHEALALVFAQFRTRLDNGVLSRSIPMMGVYPPGSVAQLADGRFVLVVSVNSSRPLKPRLIVHDPAVPRHEEALIPDLEQAPAASIRRRLKPASWPAAALDDLSPRQRRHCFFERTVAHGLREATS